MSPTKVFSAFRTVDREEVANNWSMYCCASKSGLSSSEVTVIEGDSESSLAPVVRGAPVGDAELAVSSPVDDLML